MTPTKWGHNFYQVACNSCKKLFWLLSMHDQWSRVPLKSGRASSKWETLKRQLWNLIWWASNCPPCPATSYTPEWATIFPMQPQKKGPHIMQQGCFNYILWSSVRPLVATTAGACRSIILPCDRDRRKRFGRAGGEGGRNPILTGGAHYPLPN